MPRRARPTSSPAIAPMPLRRSANSILRATKLKFEPLGGRRARPKERGKRPHQGSLAEMDALWDAIKAAEKTTYDEGKKVNWKDGVRAPCCIVKYNLFR